MFHSLLYVYQRVYDLICTYVGPCQGWQGTPWNTALLTSLKRYITAWRRLPSGKHSYGKPALVIDSYDLIWLVVLNMFYDFPYLGNVIIPTDETKIFQIQRGWLKPPTSLSLIAVILSMDVSIFHSYVGLSLSTIIDHH